MLSLSDCIPWMTVGLAESVTIVTLNLCTIIVFIRNRNLRKRSTYLVINLAVIDMLVGGVAVYVLFYWPGVDCNLWKLHSFKVGTDYFITVLMGLFVFGSLINIAIIALERVHATFFPFRHRVLKKWVYRLIIAVVWLTSGLVGIAPVVLEQFEERYYSFYWYATSYLICLLIICVSYSSIVIKVRCRGQPQHHGATSRERKLTMTLLIVTVVSLLLYLPHVILRYVIYISKFKIWRSLTPSVRFHLDYALLVLLCANSLVNSILYAMHMPEYRSALLALFRKLRPQQQRQVVVFPLRDIHGATSRERKLTMTLLIVTVVSLLLYLPHVIMDYVVFISKFKILQSLSFSVVFHLNSALKVLFHANSLVNPILYAIRMPEYRSALLALFRKRPQQQRQVAVFPLHDM
ncbi:melatonin receptor type 1B-like [Orbicella faveolata]|uniref:melatonin receptor type 1B-like n=1 Tax=Orbicella faveolata TaxID=48498 RepID=UPI0009E39786|nr:melatonin receptor type 1B-like [Orbicella faveolata]